MIIQLDLESEVPIYLQLKHQIIEGIATHQLVAGEALPSVRGLAADLGVNMHTVNKAYQLLKQDGFILIHRQKGVVINPEMPKADQAFVKGLKRELKPLITESICRGMDKEKFSRICEEMFSIFEKGGE